MLVLQPVAIAMEAGIQGRIASLWWMVEQVAPRPLRRLPSPVFPILPAATDIHQAPLIQLQRSARSTQSMVARLSNQKQAIISYRTWPSSASTREDLWMWRTWMMMGGGLRVRQRKSSNWAAWARGLGVRLRGANWRVERRNSH